MYVASLIGMSSWMYMKTNYLLFQRTFPINPHFSDSHIVGRESKTHIFDVNIFQERQKTE